MSWIGSTCLIAVLVIFMGVLAAYLRGYKEGYRDGVEASPFLEEEE